MNILRVMAGHSSSKMRVNALMSRPSTSFLRLASARIDPTLRIELFAAPFNAASSQAVHRLHEIKYDGFRLMARRASSTASNVADEHERHSPALSSPGAAEALLTL
jgi:hypothetical protein